MKEHLVFLVLGLIHALHGAAINSNDVLSEAKEIAFKHDSFKSTYSPKQEVTNATKTEGGFIPVLPGRIPPFKYFPTQQVRRVPVQYFRIFPIAQYQFTRPTQIQYVAPQTLAQYWTSPFTKFQNVVPGNASSAADLASVYSNAPVQQVALQQQQQPFALQQQQQPFALQQQQQQPFLTYYQFQPQAAISNFIYQQPKPTYYLYQTPQQVFSNYPEGKLQLTKVAVAQSQEGTQSPSSDEPEAKTPAEQKAPSEPVSLTIY